MYAGGFTTSVRYDCEVLFEQMIRPLVRVLRIVLFKVTFRYIYQPHILGCWYLSVFVGRLIVIDWDWELYNYQER